MGKLIHLAGLLFALVVIPALAFGTQLKQFSVKISQEDTGDKLSGTAKLGEIFALEGDYKITATLDGSIVNSVVINAFTANADTGVSDDPAGRLEAAWDGSKARITVKYSNTTISEFQSHALRITIHNGGEQLLAGQGTAGFDAPTPSTLYDDFSSPSLDPNKWNITATAGCTVEGSFLGESLRTLQVFTGATNNCGVTFANPAPITGFSADITVLEYTENTGNMRARLLGNFFNGLTSTPEPGSSEGNILGIIQVKDFGEVSPDPNEGFVQYVIVVCWNFDCSFNALIDSGSVGAVFLGETTNLSMDWDGDTTFTFQLDDKPPIVVDISGPGFSWTNHGPPGFKGMQLRSRGTGSPTGSMDVLYDNVRCHTLDGSPCPPLAHDGTISILSLDPPEGTPLTRGSAVPFEVTVDFDITSGGNGTVFALLRPIPYGEGTPNITIDSQAVTGSGQVTLTGTVLIERLADDPESQLDAVEVLTTLLLEGQSSTSIDDRSAQYPVDVIPDTMTYSLSGAPDVTIAGEPGGPNCVSGTFITDGVVTSISASSSSGDSISLFFSGLGAGIYASVPEVPHPGAVVTIGATEFIAGDGTVIVTEYGNVGGLIVGTFDLPILTGDLFGQTFTGSFNVTREADDNMTLNCQ